MRRGWAVGGLRSGLALVLVAATAAVAAVAPSAEATGTAGPVEVVGAESVSGAGSIGAGTDFTCGLTAAGGVRCFGRGSAGQLGRGSSAESALPVDVTGLTTGVASLAVGSSHACAVTTTGGAMCWGDNTYSQLGRGPVAGSTSLPAPVSGLASGVAAIAAGGSSTSDTSHTCALTTAGGVKCWGGNGLGQLGNGSNTTSNVPVDVVGLDSGVAAVTAGGTTSCALTTAGGVKCWGRHVGNGSGAASNVPVGVTGLSAGVASIAAGGQQICAITTAGAALCWGGGGNGQLGNGSTSSSVAVPVAVTGLGSGVASLAGGSFHTCAVMVTGGARCWGANLSGQIGDGTKGGNDPLPVEVAGVTNVIAVAAGDGHSCALLSTGSMSCWGDDYWGELGDGQRLGETTPVQVGGLGSGVAAVTAGREVACALTTVGAAQCWGDSGFGRLGTGATQPTYVPSTVTGLGSGVSHVAAADAGYFTCAITTAALRCWGKNSDGELGNGRAGSTAMSSPTPVQVSGLEQGVAQVALGTYHACALTTAGGVKCWGRNSAGEVGNGTTTTATTPVDVQGLTAGVSWIAAGGSTSCAVTTAGAVLCWGQGDRGQRGDGTTAASSTPVAVPTLASVVASVAVAGHHTCALTTAGAVSCWGYNADGQVGNGSTSISGVLTPTPVGGLSSGVTAITASSGHSCARTAAGAALCWGSNSYGELGDGTFERKLAPAPVSGLGSGVTSLDAGSFNTCARTAAGAALCWGYESNGQLGTEPGWHPRSVSGGTAWKVPGRPLGISASATPAPNAAGWNNTPVTVTFTCTGGAPPVTCPAPVVLGEGGGQQATGIATDAVGQQSASAQGIDVDLTAPTVSGAPTAPAGPTGWQAGPLTLHWTCADALSGVAPGACPADEVVAASGTTTRTASASDRAGNPSGTASVTLRIDGRPVSFTTWGALVTRLYQDLMGRAPTATEASTWVGTLQAGTATPGGLVGALRGSADHLRVVDPVTRLYRAYFLRIPDRGGLTYWIGRGRAGTSLTAISATFAGSREFASRYGSLGNAAFVDLVYRNVLGRPGEASGMAYWAAQLTSGRRTRGQVMVGFSESKEYKAAQASEVTAAVLPVLLAQRTPTAAGYAVAVAGLDAGTSTTASLAAEIINSTAYPPG